MEDEPNKRNKKRKSLHLVDIFYLFKAVRKKAFDFFDRDKNGRVDFKEFC